jgi:acyl-CoA synthetase (NDP forming)
MTETRRFSPQRLRGLFEPQSVALVGASDKSSWSMMVHNNLTLGEYTGRIYYINPRNPAVHGRPAVPRLADIGEPVDLAYIMVPGEAVLPVVREMAEVGIHNAIVLTAGFAEQDEEGLLVGVVRDPVWGRVVAVGLGGIWVEILKDTSLRMLPVSRRDV